MSLVLSLLFVVWIVHYQTLLHTTVYSIQQKDSCTKEIAGTGIQGQKKKKKKTTIQQQKNSSKQGQSVLQKVFGNAVETDGETRMGA